MSTVRVAVVGAGLSGLQSNALSEKHATCKS